MMASQAIDYLPRYAWFVTLNAGVSVDAFLNERTGATVENPMYEHEWIATEAGSSSTSFVRQSSYLWARRLTPFIGLLISPPWWWTNWSPGRIVLQVSVGVPINQPRGIAQYGLGAGFWWREGVSLVLSGILRAYDQPISGVGAAQLVLTNNGSTPPATPVIGVREAVAGGLSLSLAVDLGKVGEAFLGAVKPLFTKEGK